MADSKNERGLADFALVKQGDSPDSTVQDKIGEVSSSEAWTARHADLLPKTRRSRQGKDSRPLFFFPCADVPIYVGQSSAKSEAYPSLRRRWGSSEGWGVEEGTGPPRAARWVRAAFLLLFDL